MLWKQINVGVLVDDAGSARGVWNIKSERVQKLPPSFNVQKTLPHIQDVVLWGFVGHVSSDLLHKHTLIHILGRRPRKGSKLDFDSANTSQGW